MTVNYKKPFRSVTEQIELLRERGMGIDDDSWAAELLAEVGYYRLSGYFYGFRKFPKEGEALTDEWQTRQSAFVEGTNLRVVNDIYEFDRKVRMRIFDGIEKFEIALRFAIGHLVAQNGAFAHRDFAHVSPEFAVSKKAKFINLDGTSTDYLVSDHSVWLSELDRQEARSQEAFAIHHRNKYGSPLPIWKSTEVMSFGTLVALYDGLQQQHREQIASELDVLDGTPKGDIATLSNWLNHIRYVRNTCAHHARLWNRNYNVIIAETPQIADLAHMLPMEPRTHVYGTIAILSYLLARTHPGNDWRDKTLAFIEEGTKAIGQDLATLGFPANWRDESLWQASYQRDAARAHRIRTLSRFETRTTSSAASLLHSIEPKERNSRLRYLRTNHALLGLKISETYQYPVFQFDAATGDVPAAVVETNRRIYMSMRGSSDEGIAWASAEWWLTPRVELGGLPAHQALRDGTLDVPMIDTLLPGPSE